MNNISLNRMLYFQMNDRPIGHAKASKKGFIQPSCGLEGPPDLGGHNPSTGNYLFNRAPLLSSCKGRSLIGDLTVSTELPGTGEASQCCSGGSSPPPPALSPASSSPTHLLHGLFNQTSSPSPPVIVAEIAGHSSGSSRTTSEKSHPTKPLASDALCNPERKTSPSKIESNSASEIRTAPRLTSISSSSSSSSSTTSSSSAQHASVHARNGLPILEKISIAMGSPRKNLQDGPMPLTREASDSSEIKFSSPVGLRSPNISISFPLASTDCQVQCHRLEQVTTDGAGVNLEEETKFTIQHKGVSSSGGLRKRNPRNTTRRRRLAKRRRGDSDSDFELEKPTGKLSRGKADAVAAIRRIKQSSTGKKSFGKGASADQQKTASTEAGANKRYLESPFLCLCQSGSTVANLSQTTALIQNRNNLPADSSTHSTSNPVESAIEAASMPAHIISPALRGLSGQGTNLGMVNSNFSIPPSCPLNAGNHGPSSTLEKTAENTETRTLFSGISYKPSVQQRLRDIQQSLESNSLQTTWLCAFCGEDNNFLGLGSLYGPYYVTASEKAQIITECVAQASVAANAPSPPATTKEVRPGDRKSKLARSGVITSTLTRSAAAQGRSTVANMGALRLVIKAPNRPTTKEEPSNNKPRVGADGEVWVHLECALWAPGTHVLGDGTIGGLGEALQLSLDTVCSHCDKRGAILNCCSRGCNLSYHYRCALLTECQLDYDQYTLLCKKHHIYS